MVISQSPLTFIQTLLLLAALSLPAPARGQGTAAPVHLTVTRVSSKVSTMPEADVQRLLSDQLTTVLLKQRPPGTLHPKGDAGAAISVELNITPLAAGAGPRARSSRGARLDFDLRTNSGQRRQLRFEQKSLTTGPSGMRVMAEAVVRAAGLLAAAITRPADTAAPGAARAAVEPTSPVAGDAPPPGGEKFEESGRASVIQAVRTATAPTIDGQLNDAVWSKAVPFSDFVESTPNEGASPSQKTEVRVLYDDAMLYVGVISFDTEPQLIERQVAKRDNMETTSDFIYVAIDAAYDRRSAAAFSVTASGTQIDGLYYGDFNLALTWDAVWEGKAAARPDGWSAELAIPLSTLRFPAAAEQKWGFHAGRFVSRTHQFFDSTVIPVTSDAFVSRFGLLKGVKSVKPRRNLEVVPYMAARLNSRPQFSDPAHPTPHLLEPSADVGVDVRASLFSNLTLNATLNPDFGQVEADQLILNLTNFELQFPEKRPFFNQGLDLFSPVGVEFSPSHRLFYSRRIGIDSPIFGAAKVSGTVIDGLQVGVLDAVVMGPANPSRAAVAFTEPTPEQLAALEASPDRRVMFFPQRPFHVGLNSELPTSRPTSKNYLASVVRADLTDSFSLGATFAASSPLAARCTPADFSSPEDYAAADCSALGGQVAGLDWNLRSADREWAFLGMLDGSRREGGPARELLPDGVAIRPGDLGYGGYLIGGRVSGDGLRAWVDASYASPRLDLDQTGFLFSQNIARAAATMGFFSTKEISGLRDVRVSLTASTLYTTEGRWTPRGNDFGWDLALTLASAHAFSGGMSFSMPRFDVREISGAAIPVERRNVGLAYLGFASDPQRAVTARLRVYGTRAFEGGPVPVQYGYGGQASLILRPLSQLETKLDVQYANEPNGARFVGALPDSDQLEPSRLHFLFGEQLAQSFSATLRQSVALLPTLTLEAYAQLFAAYAHYPQYFEGAAPPGGAIRLGQLAPTSATGAADFHDAALNLNVVLRWEFRLGSTLFLVYSHSQSELGLGELQEPTRALFPMRLGPGPRSDTVMLKWSWWFNA